jgi:hypothetical protein
MSWHDPKTFTVTSAELTRAMLANMRELTPPTVFGRVRAHIGYVALGWILGAIFGITITALVLAT